MTRETKVGLVVAASFACLVGGVFATKYLHKQTQPEGAAPVAEAPKQPAGEETQQVPLYAPPEAPAGPATDLPPPPPPGLSTPPYEPKRTAAAAKLDDPMKDDEFVPSLPPPGSPTPQLQPVPVHPAPAAALPAFDLVAPPAKDTKKAPATLDLDPPPSPTKKPAALSPPEGTFGPPPGGVARVGNPPTTGDPLLELVPPNEPKKDAKKEEKKDEKKDVVKLPTPGGDPKKDDELPGLNLPAPMSGTPALPPPASDKPMPPAPPPMPKTDKADAPKPLDLPPNLPKKPAADLPKTPIDLPGPPPKLTPTPPVEPRDDAPPPKTNNSAAAASLNRPMTEVGPPEARVESYDEEWYYCKQGDTLESISQKFFFSPKYEQALRQYNLDRNYQASFRQERPSLTIGQVVKVPPARILEKYYPATLGGARPPASPRSDGATNIPSTPTEDLGSPREYQVRREGMTLRDIAKEELHDERQWTRIFNLNREWNPSAAIPVGTRIYLPRAQ